MNDFRCIALQSRILSYSMTRISNYTETDPATVGRVSKDMYLTIVFIYVGGCGCNDNYRFLYNMLFNIYIKIKKCCYRCLLYYMYRHYNVAIKKYDSCVKELTHAGYLSFHSCFLLLFIPFRMAPILFSNIYITDELLFDKRSLRDAFR